MSQQAPQTQGLSGSYANGAQEAPPRTIEIPPGYVSENAHHLASINEYKTLYAESIADPCSFWSRLAQTGFYWKDWVKKRDSLSPVLDANFTPSKLNPVRTTFAKGCVTNISYNCVDRHVEAGRGSTTAIIFEPNDPMDVSSRSEITYGELLVRVKELAATLRDKGVRAGHVVTIYMPMVPDLPVAMLACARIGAIHSVVFGGFSAESLAGRIRDAQSTCVVTCDGVYRGAKLINLKSTVDAAVEICAHASQFLRAVKVSSVIVLERVGRNVTTVRMVSGRDVWWSDAVAAATENMVSDAVEWVDSEHPLFILYTSGSTGKPKGVQHATGGYMVYAATTFKYAFNYQPGDVFFCTADCGWITGHSYVTYGPMLNGATQVVFEGVPNFPDAGRLWDITDRYNVAMLYTAPTAIRALKRAGDGFVSSYSRKSLKVLGSVGEPINPEAYMWYFNVVGNGRCPIVDTVCSILSNVLHFCSAFP
jgi:acetyl-CoA synthetase